MSRWLSPSPTRRHGSKRGHVLAGLDNGARNWAPPLPGLVREAQDNPDPRLREQARASIEKSAAGLEQTPAMSVRMLNWAAGSGGGAEWQPLQQPPGRGLGFAVPGTAGR